MNEPIPHLPSTDPHTPPVYKDRSTGLIIFGGLTVLLGCLSGLFALLTSISLQMARHTGATPNNPSAILMAVSFYGGLTVMLIWLGVGSIMARRWARALLLIFSWSWLVLGVFMTATTPFFAAGAFANLTPNLSARTSAISPEVVSGIIVGIVIFFSVFFVLVPAIWVFFYGSRDVKITCESCDPVSRWTDDCPLPVLGACLWMLFGAAILLIMVFVGHAAMPFFGMFLNGIPGILIYLVMAVLWTYAAWLLYQLDVRGWWLSLIIVAATFVSSMLKYAHHDIIELYQQMGYPQAQIEEIKKLNLMLGSRMG